MHPNPSTVFILVVFHKSTFFFGHWKMAGEKERNGKSSKSKFQKEKYWQNWFQFQKSEKSIHFTVCCLFEFVCDVTYYARKSITILFASTFTVHRTVYMYRYIGTNWMWLNLCCAVVCADALHIRLLHQYHAFGDLSKGKKNRWKKNCPFGDFD